MLNAHTAIPNILFDLLLPLLFGSDIKIILVVCRSTFGWHKDEDTISIGQISRATGLSRRHVTSRLQILRRSGVLLQSEHGAWRFNSECNQEQVNAALAGELNSPCTHFTGELISPKLVNSFPKTGELIAPTKEIKKKESKSRRTDPELEALRRVWEHYLKKFGRKENSYSFTALRKNKGLARLRECAEKTEGDLDKAVDLMELAIERMAKSDWHMGQNPQGKRYVDWEKHLFRSAEQLENWWQQ